VKPAVAGLLPNANAHELLNARAFLAVRLEKFSGVSATSLVISI
jgi:hypothetical protein